MDNEFEISKTFISQFLSCKATTYLKYVKGIRPEGRPSDSLVYGKIVHKIMEESIRAKEIKTNEILNQDLLQEAEDDPLKRAEIYTQIRVLMDFFFQMNSMYLEREPLIDPETKLTYGSLIGYPDFVYKEPSSGIIVVIDFKTTSFIKLVQLELLKYDIQCNLYLYLVSRYYPAEKYLFMQETIKKIHYLLKQKKGETERDYENRLRLAIFPKLNEYLFKFPCYRTKAQIDYWADKWLQPVMNDIHRWIDNDYQPRYVNPDALFYYNKSEYFDYLVGDSYKL